MAKIDHAAISTASYEDAQKFFEDVFEMHMWREIGEKPGRKCWYEEGIQLCEMEEYQYRRRKWIRPYFDCGRFCRRDDGKDQSLSGKSNQ